MNLLKSTKTKTLTQLIGDAGLSIPTQAAKEFQTAVERYQNAKHERGQNATALAENETKVAGFSESFEALKANLAAELAAGSKTEADVAAELHTARDAHDLAEVTASGLRIRSERAEDELSKSIAALVDAHGVIKFAIGEATRKMLREKAAPFASAVRKCIAIDASLRIGMTGLHGNRLTDPENSGLPLGIDSDRWDPFLWESDQDAVSISTALDPFGQIIFEAQREAIDADNRRAELNAKRMREATRLAQESKEARFGTATDHGPANAPFAA